MKRGGKHITCQKESLWIYIFCTECKHLNITVFTWIWSLDCTALPTGPGAGGFPGAVETGLTHLFYMYYSNICLIPSDFSIEPYSKKEQQAGVKYYLKMFLLQDLSYVIPSTYLKQIKILKS